MALNSRGKSFGHATESGAIEYSMAPLLMFDLWGIDFRCGTTASKSAWVLKSEVFRQTLFLPTHSTLVTFLGKRGTPPTCRESR